ncbi:MAG: phosphoethanolamine--lipid A transferase EptA [Gammaproteobacteria bacterium]|nr:phosphoethanolamine--lipid A transferase EptA [Sideroxydans sp.]MBU3902627.1 phosphoethanolamine--lipid A transferase EptA [Gammaproteobacteria bacterium]MBU4046658.1 phosphoethanolamine--lipid A transferase EptA [Gammaproteobacteria bacterium]
MSLRDQIAERLTALYRRTGFNPSATKFILIFAALNGVLYHLPLYSFAVKDLAPLTLPSTLTLLTLFVLVMLLTVLVMFLFALVSQRLLKPLAMLIVFSNAFALYFIQAYQVVLDKAMMGNVFNTNTSEAGSYLSYSFLWHVLLFGVLPAWLISRVTIRHVSRLRTIAALLLSFIVGIGWLYGNAQSWLWIDKHGRKLGGMILPWSYVINATRYQAEKAMQSRELELLPSAHFTAQGKTIVVLVIGESARAANFSLYGYARDTNPLLRQAGVTALRDARACSTYTTASLQCMLSHVDTGNTLFHSHEALPSYLQRSGIATIWLTRNWGEPPLKVNTYLRDTDIRSTCSGPHCDYDEVLLTGLQQRIASMNSDKVFVVLHQSGSHGPDYYNHYPADGEKFSPVCRSVQLQDCTPDTVTNAYDNTILYTDRFLSETISVLRAIPNTQTMMMYISDHGESLGEYGLYLHGTPYSLAPDVQKDIPYIVWMSDAFKQHKTLAADAALAQAKHAQQTVFHSIMGAFDLRSDIYDPELDIFKDAANKKR